jgi:hypothetical protein
MIRIASVVACLPILLATPALAATVTVPPKAQPESITAAPNGELILGSAGSAKIYRAKKGATNADVFIDASSEGNVTFLGVLADGPSNTLWACQIGATAPKAPLHTTLRSFDLSTGAPGKVHWDLPGDQNLCNDFVVGPDKALYVSDTFGSKIWRLAPGATVPEVWLEDRTLNGIDGITFLNGVMYENNVIFNKIYRVPVDANGKPGRPVDIWTDKPIKGPDGMRAAGNKLFLTENAAGKVDAVTIEGDTAHITVLVDGLGTPTAIEPAGNTLWYGERSNDRASSMPLPK